MGTEKTTTLETATTEETTEETSESMAETLAEAAEQIEADALAEEPDSERYTHYFKRPFTYEGRTVETLTFDCLFPRDQGVWGAPSRVPTSWLGGQVTQGGDPTCPGRRPPPP